MRKVIALVLVLTMALTFCACGKNTEQTPTDPETVTTPAPTESEAPADEPEESTGPTVENIREEGFTSNGTPIVSEYDGVTGELVLTEFYSDEGCLEMIVYFKDGETTMQVDYRPDGKVEREYYMEHGETVKVVSYYYDEAGNLVDTIVDNFSDLGNEDEGGTGANHVETYHYDDGSYMMEETNAYGELVYTAFYNTEGMLTTEQIFENGLAVQENHYENFELVSYNKYVYDGYDMAWSGFYSRAADGSFVLDFEQYYGENQPSGGDQPSSPQTIALPELNEYDYVYMSANDIESAFAANGFAITREGDEYVDIAGTINGTQRAYISMSENLESLPWILFTHEASDSSAAMDIGLRGIKTHDSLSSVLNKLGIRNAETVADKLEYVYNMDDYSAWDDTVLAAYTEDGKYVYFGVIYYDDEGRDLDQIGVYIEYIDEAFLINFYFEEGILVGFETM